MNIPKLRSRHKTQPKSGPLSSNNPHTLRLIDQKPVFPHLIIIRQQIFPRFQHWTEKPSCMPNTKIPGTADLCTMGQICRSTKNPDVSTGLLAPLFARSLAPLTRSHAPHYALRSAALTRSLARSLRSLPRSWESEFFMSQNDMVLSHSGLGLGWKM